MVALQPSTYAFKELGCIPSNAQLRMTWFLALLGLCSAGCLALQMHLIEAQKTSTLLGLGQGVPSMFQHPVRVAALSKISHIRSSLGEANQFQFGEIFEQLNPG